MKCQEKHGSLQNIIRIRNYTELGPSLQDIVCVIRYIRETQKEVKLADSEKLETNGNIKI